MRKTMPFVVVLAAAARRIGRSTLMDNLAVYLRGMAEDLPLAAISFDPGHDPAQTFVLPDNPAPGISQLFQGQSLDEQLALGQFGIEYLKTDTLPPLSSSTLRQLLRESCFPGILLVDAGPLGEKPASTALRAADLVISPLRNASGLAALAGIRREIRAGGGTDDMLWLVPAMIEDPRQQERQLALLRFAARERGCQVLDHEFMVDLDLPEATRGPGGSVLTRMPESRTRPLFYHLARLVLRQFESGASSACHLQRLRMDDALPPRFRRVEVICPLCGNLACFDLTHYCESLPQRRRWLLHAECFARLMTTHRLKSFWGAGQAAVLRTAVEADGQSSQLKLLLPDADGSCYESDLFSPAADSGWQTLVRRATGRTLAEQFPAVIMIYPALSGKRVLGVDWYRSCAALRKRLRAGLAEEV